MLNPSRFILWTFVGALAAVPLFAQKSAGLVTPIYTKVAEFDSLAVSNPAMSPDRRWIAFSGGPIEGRDRSIWIMPAKGGSPRRLTGGSYVDETPRWFPASDRLVFKSSRVNGALMTIGIDKVAGTVTQLARRLTLERGSGPSVSPDGRFVVYSTNDLLPHDTGVGMLRIVPGNGGPARTLDSGHSTDDGFLSAHFTTDGKYIEYAVGHSHGLQEVRRVPVAGGSPRVLVRGNADTELNRVAVRQLLLTNGVGFSDYRPGSPALALRNMTGETTAVITISGMRNPQFQSPRVLDGSLLVVTDKTPSQSMIVGLDGGRPTALRAPSDGEYMGSILANGDITIDTEQGARAGIDVRSATGALRRHIVLPGSAQPGYLTNDGRLAYWRDGSTRGVYDVGTGKVDTLSRRFVRGAGLWDSQVSSQDEDAWVEWSGRNVELRAWSPQTRRTQLIQSLPIAIADMRDYTIAKSVAVYSYARGDSILIEGAQPGGAPHRLIALPGRHTDGLSISPDGRRLAAGVQLVSGSDTAHVIAFISLAGDGSAVGAPRFTHVGNPSEVRWLPGTREVVFLQINLGGAVHPTELMRLADRDGAQPQAIPLQENRRFWDFEVSNDGKTFVYPVELASKMAIWRVDLSRTDR